MSNSNKTLIAIFGGLGALVLLCCCCCFAAMVALPQNEDFKEGYCEGWLEDNYDFEEEPFGWCDDYFVY